MDKAILFAVLASFLHGHGICMQRIGARNSERGLRHLVVFRLPGSRWRLRGRMIGGFCSS